MNIQEQVKQIFNEYAQENNFSGAALVKKGDLTIFQGAYGEAHKGFEIKNTITTKFDTASITKLFTTVGILQLIDKSLISFEDKVLEILDIKDTTISKEVNIYQLLTHTSGICDDADEEAGEEYEDIWKEKPNYSVRETVDFLPQFIHKEPNFKPGNGCRYNNVAFVLLGLVIEKITGRKYREYIKENVFNKIGMNDTDFYSMDGVNENVAEGYAEICNEKDEVIGWRKNIYSYPPIGSPDSGAYTTVADLDLFVREIYNGRVLSKAMTAGLFTPKVVHTKYEKITHMMGYGYEFIVSNDNNEVRYITKDGCNPGVACKFNYYPSIDTTLVVLANQDCNVWDLAGEVEEILIGKIN
ncbi:beta-lactamase family protein [Clostridium tagluense]|uniref:serine hydrolase domain-containing protein n=1 Tax=Clostridium tagluense TaxID=360422 RepID=UPI001CF48610|nr:serine hydrolase domain-containing protein [Clostridium tagluense]MCB2311799.1 beta-lactamase family protein [Clostridium tagluense]MCB2316479.1 beta-lactamase family protein [Clostridium tagluense]MCB2321379.1 beta-lactamase family protein [Clostridium tagluense]MCB2326348.1 beta-lactamase family protein [Clostridium tagluense]MCB2331071.1 beta-lactamase family protein [Clostridium tagluense]